LRIKLIAFKLKIYLILCSIIYLLLKKLKYHYFTANQALKTEQFTQSLTSELDGNPPLWVTRRQGSRGHEEIFINNARIIEGSNYEFTFTPNESGKKRQVIFIAIT
jgi:hypothetical protein